MFCPHGICIAFSILTRHEGPRIAFELILRRFTIGPYMIVYDNVRMRAFFSVQTALWPRILAS